MKTDRIALLLFVFLALTRPATAEVLSKWLDQTVYIPVYSHIYPDGRFKNTPFLLTATLVIRNADPDKPFTLKSVRYYDSKDRLLNNYLDKPMTIEPLGSTWFIVPESESQGGVGAKFLVDWKAENPVVEPIMESVMIGTKMQQGISFLSTGRVIKGTPAR